MNNLKAVGVHYISNRMINQNDAVMFDIDDTLIFTNGRLNIPMVELLYVANDMGYKIVIITARVGTDPVIKFTINQLKEYNIMYDYLGFTSAETKIDMKEQLPFNFILSVGDMPTDLTGSTHWLNISTFSHNWDSSHRLSWAHRPTVFVTGNRSSCSIYTCCMWRIRRLLPPLFESDTLSASPCAHYPLLSSRKHPLVEVVQVS